MAQTLTNYNSLNPRVTSITTCRKLLPQQQTHRSLSHRVELGLQDEVELRGIFACSEGFSPPAHQLVVAQNHEDKATR